MLDKIVLLLLILTLPVGVVVAQRYGRAGSGVESEETVKKVDALINQINQSNQQPAAAAPQQAFSISTVHLATESGTLMVTGVAPKTNAQVMMSAVVTPIGGTKTQTTSKKTASDSAEPTEVPVLGDSIETHAVSVEAGGVFVINYPVEDIDATQKIELHLEQGMYSTSVIYNVKEKKFEQV